MLRGQQNRSYPIRYFDNCAEAATVNGFGMFRKTLLISSETAVASRFTMTRYVGWPGNSLKSNK